ncbi:uncharacterized protein LOC142322649 [Lycorma delicatula]|uniref:uncharacterized protein LOC142322649 n=1 Tax=Lycorma delicatula TaxID=130591 RepID=UPI003F513E8C
MKNKKSTGVDNPPKEFCKFFKEEGVEEIIDLCNRLYSMGEWSHDFGKRLMIPILKITGTRECTEHRTLSLITHAAKTLLRVLKEVGFKSGSQSIEDDPRPGRTSTSIDDTCVQEINDLVRTNRHFTVREQAEEISILIGSCRDILTEKLNVHRVATKFIPRLMTEKQKVHQVDVYITETKEQEMQDVTTESEKDDFEFLGEKTVSSQLSGQNKIEMINQETMTDIKIFRRSRLHASTSTDGLAETALNNYCFVDFENYILSIRQKKPETGDTNLDVIVHQGDTEEETESEDEFVDKSDEDSWLYSPHFELWTKEWLEMESIGIMSKNVEVDCFEEEVNDVFSFAKLQPVYSLLEYPQQVINFSKTKHKATKSKKYKKGNYKVKEEEVEFIGEKSRRIEEEELNFILLSWFYGENASEKEETKKSKEDLLKCTGSSSSHVSSVVDLEKTREYGLRETTKVSEEDIEKEIAVEEEESDISILSDEILKESSTSSSACSLPESNEELVNLYYECIYAIRELQVQEKRSQKLEVAPDVHDEEDDFEYTDVEDEEIDKIIKEGGVDDDDDDDDKDDDYDDDEGVDDDDDDDDDDDEDNDEFTLEELIDDSEQSEVKEEGDAQKVQQDEGKGKKSISDNREGVHESNEFNTQVEDEEEEEDEDEDEDEDEEEEEEEEADLDEEKGGSFVDNDKQIVEEEKLGEGRGKDDKVEKKASINKKGDKKEGVKKKEDGKKKEDDGKIKRTHPDLISGNEELNKEDNFDLKARSVTGAKMGNVKGDLKNSIIYNEDEDEIENEEELDENVETLDEQEISKSEDEIFGKGSYGSFEFERLSIRSSLQSDYDVFVGQYDSAEILKEEDDIENDDRKSTEGKTEERESKKDAGGESLIMMDVHEEVKVEGGRKGSDEEEVLDEGEKEDSSSYESDENDDEEEDEFDDYGQIELLKKSDIPFQPEDFTAMANYDLEDDDDSENEIYEDENDDDYDIIEGLEDEDNEDEKSEDEFSKEKSYGDEADQERSHREIVDETVGHQVDESETDITDITPKKKKQFQRVESDVDDDDDDEDDYNDDDDTTDDDGSDDYNVEDGDDDDDYYTDFDEEDDSSDDDNDSESRWYKTKLNVMIETCSTGGSDESGAENKKEKKIIGTQSDTDDSENFRDKIEEKNKKDDKYKKKMEDPSRTRKIKTKNLGGVGVSDAEIFDDAINKTDNAYLSAYSSYLQRALRSQEVKENAINLFTQNICDAETLAFDEYFKSRKRENSLIGEHFALRNLLSSEDRSNVIIVPRELRKKKLFLQRYHKFKYFKEVKHEDIFDVEDFDNDWQSPEFGLSEFVVILEEAKEQEENRPPIPLHDILAGEVDKTNLLGNDYEVTNVNDNVKEIENKVYNSPSGLSFLSYDIQHTMSMAKNNSLTACISPSMWELSQISDVEYSSLEIFLKNVAYIVYMYNDKPMEKEDVIIECYKEEKFKSGKIYLKSEESDNNGNEEQEQTIVLPVKIELKTVDKEFFFQFLELLRSLTLNELKEFDLLDIYEHFKHVIISIPEFKEETLKTAKKKPKHPHYMYRSKKYFKQIEEKMMTLIQRYCVPKETSSKALHFSDKVKVESTENLRAFSSATYNRYSELNLMSIIPGEVFIGHTSKSYRDAQIQVEYVKPRADFALLGKVNSADVSVQTSDLITTLLSDPNSLSSVDLDLSDEEEDIYWNKLYDALVGNVQIAAEIIDFVLEHSASIELPLKIKKKEKCSSDENKDSLVIILKNPEEESDRESNVLGMDESLVEQESEECLTKKCSGIRLKRSRAFTSHRNIDMQLSKSDVFIPPSIALKNLRSFLNAVTELLYTPMSFKGFRPWPLPFSRPKTFFRKDKTLKDKSLLIYPDGKPRSSLHKVHSETYKCENQRNSLHVSLSFSFSKDETDESYSHCFSTSTLTESDIDELTDKGLRVISTVMNEGNVIFHPVPESSKVSDKSIKSKKGKVKYIMKPYLSFRKVHKIVDKKSLPPRPWVVESSKGNWIWVEEYLKYDQLKEFNDLFGSVGEKGIATADEFNLRMRDVLWEKLIEEDPSCEPYRGYGSPLRVPSKSEMKLPKFSVLIHNSKKVSSMKFEPDIRIPAFYQQPSDMWEENLFPSCIERLKAVLDDTVICPYKKIDKELKDVLLPTKKVKRRKGRSFPSGSATVTSSSILKPFYDTDENSVKNDRVLKSEEPTKMKEEAKTEGKKLSVTVVDKKQVESPLSALIKDISISGYQKEEDSKENAAGDQNGSIVKSVKAFWWNVLRLNEDIVHDYEEEIDGINVVKSIEAEHLVYKEVEREIELEVDEEHSDGKKDVNEQIKVKSNELQDHENLEEQIKEKLDIENKHEVEADVEDQLENLRYLFFQEKVKFALPVFQPNDRSVYFDILRQNLLKLIYESRIEAGYKWWINRYGEDVEVDEADCEKHPYNFDYDPSFLNIKSIKDLNLEESDSSSSEENEAEELFVCLLMKKRSRENFLRRKSVYSEDEYYKFIRTTIKPIQEACKRKELSFIWKKFYITGRESVDSGVEFIKKLKGVGNQIEIEYISEQESDVDILPKSEMSEVIKKEPGEDEIQESDKVKQQFNSKVVTPQAELKKMSRILTGITVDEKQGTQLLRVVKMLIPSEETTEAMHDDIAGEPLTLTKEIDNHDVQDVSSNEKYEEAMVKVTDVRSNDEDLEIKSSSESEEEPDPVLDNVVNLKLKGSEFSYGSQEFLPYVRPAVPLEKTHQKFMATGTLFYDGSRVYESETDESYCEKIKDENTLTVLHSFLHEGCYVKRGITPACKTICRKKHAEIALPESYKKLLESDSVCTKKTYNEEETIDEIKGFYFTMLAEDEEDDDEGDEDLKVFVTAIKRRLKEVQEECCHKDAHTGTKSIVFYPEFVYNATVDQEETVTPELEEKQGRVSSTEEFNYVLEDNVLKKLSKKLENLKEIINKKNELRKDVETQEEEITFEKEIEINSVSSDEGTTIEDPNENVKISENTVAKLNELSQLEVEKLNEIYWIFINCKTVSEAIKKQVKVVSVAIQTEIDEEYAHGMHYCDVRFNHLMEQLEDELQYKLSDTDEEVGEKEKSQQNIFMKGDTKESSDMKAELKTDYGPTYDKNGNSDYCIYEQCSVSSKKDKTDSIENWDEVKSEEDKMDKEMSEKEDHKKEKVMKLDSDFKDEKDDDSIERDMKNVLRKKEHKYKTERMERKAYVREVQLHKREMKQILKANAGPGKCRHLKTVMKRTLKSCIKLGTCLAPSYASRRRFREIKRIMFGLPLSSESSLLCINVSSETILKKLQDKKLISQSLQFFSLKRTKGDSHLSFPSHDYMLSQFEQSGVNDQKLLAEFPLTPSSSYSSSSSTLVSEKQVELINFNPESFLIEYLKTDAEILTWRKTEPLLSDYKSVVYELDSKKSSEIQKSIMQRLISKHEEEILNINYNTCSSSVKSYLDKLLEEKVISDFKNNSSSISSSIKKVFDQELRSLIKLSEFKKHQILSEEFPLKRKPAVLVTPISSDIDRIMHYMLEECEFPVLPPAHQASLITDQERRHPLMNFSGKLVKRVDYLLLQEYMNKQLLIYHKFPLSVQKTLGKTLNKVLVDYRKYRKMKEIWNAKDLFEIIEGEVKKADNIITKTWYGRILELLSKRNVFGSIDTDKLGRLLQCVCVIISSKISIAVAKNMEDFVKTLSDPKLTPQIEFEAMFKQVPEHDGIQDTAHHYILHPERKEFFAKCHGILEEIYNIGQQLPTPETILKRDYPEVARPIVGYGKQIYIAVRQDTSIHRKCHGLLEQTLKKYYDDVLKYVSLLEYKFAHVTFMEHSEELEEFIKVHSDSYEDLMKKLEYYSFKGREINRMYSYVNFTLGRFENELKEITRRALTIPQTTEELVELGKYMLFAQTRFLPQQRKEIIRFFTYHWRMIGNVSVSKKLNGLVPKIIKNVLKMDSVFEKYASLYETTKFEFEDTLREFINKTREEVHHIKPELDRLNRLCHFRKIVEYNEDAIEPLAKLIFTAYNWYVKKTFILHGQWDLLFIKDVEHWGDFFLKEFIQFHKQFKLKCRAYEKNNFPLNIFKGSTDEVDNLEKLPAPLRLINETTQHIKNFEPYINLVRILRNPNLQERHWIEMSQLVGINLTPNAGSTIARYMSIKKLRSQIDKLELISVAADKELQLEQNLRKMYDEWKNVLFNVCSFKETDLLIITQVDDIQSLLDDHIAKTLSMRGSPFVKPIEHEVKAWYDKLVRFNKTLNVWGKVQSEWLHLYPIFSSEFIRLQLPNEAKSFQDVDTKYKYVMNLLLKDRTAIITGPAPNLLELLEHCMAVIEKINVGVSRYLEKKRLVFPRFFFLSNDELLEILSHSTEPLKVQPHLIKCFEGIHKLGFSHSLMIYGMFSSEGEHVKFRKSISTEKTKGAIEKWLIQVEKQMIASLKHVTKKCIKNLYFNEKTVWVTLWPGQILLCVNQALWTASVQTALRQNTLSTSDTMLKKKSLAGIVQLLGENLTKNQRISLEALIVLEVHNKDVVADLYNHGITTDLDFKWLSQLRYYWEDGGMVVRICNVSFNYKYEYLGNSARLVITPLTDRCYRTLMGAYNLHLNGAPEGPAGTGKTETVKDLAKALAVQCIVFNCSEGLDYIAMGKFFKGLAACGAWACFDEFNRIGVEVLSAITQQMLKILHAVCHRLKFFVFEGTRLRLCPTCFVCITMNPGYAGRSELPDNLKLLFRTVAMMVPDYALIAEIVLYANGFLCARKLAIKIVTAYRLCSEQLSSQSHYDYGMRAVKAVLSAAGNLKLKYPKVDEDNVILRSIIDVNLPRFLSQDVPLFEGIISDIFPNMSPFSRDYTNFNNAVREICIQRGLQASENFMIKISQTYEMMIVRHGFMLVGDPLSGKSSILKVLADSLTLMYERNQGGSKVIYTVLNPKAVSMKELYGHFDEVSHEWHDGIAAEAFRKFGMVRTPERKWIIFDGPVDAAWIENMNTVLDDSKKLCLNSGEVIKMNPKMSMIFEVMDLREASPATVSRCGMIYLESSALGWRCIVDSWLEAWPKKRFPEFIENAVFLDRLLENYKTYYITVYEWLIPPALEFIRIHCNYVVSVGPSHRFLQALNMTDMVLTAAIVENLQLKRHDNISEYFKAWRDAAVIHGLMQGLAGAMDMESRQKFDEFFRTLLNGGYKEHPPPEFMKMLNLPKPERLMDDSFYRFRQSGFWTHWEDVISNKYMNLEPEEDIRQMLIPSIESLKYQYITEEYVKAGKPLLLVGATGTGKTFYLENYMNNKLDFSQYIPCSLALTVNITAAKTQETVINKLSKRGRGCYGPPKGKKAILFIDDLNLPAKDMYGAQPTMELLRMFFDQGFWYDLGDMSELYLEDVIVLSAMGLPGGNRQHICPRTLRHFAIYNICPFSDKSMLRIFGMLLQLGYKKNGFFSDIVPLLRLMITATIQLYHRCRKKLRPTPNKAHYLFSLRDIARCTNGLLLFTKESYFGDKKEFTRLWIHEMLRVFYDRLVNVKDRRCFLKIIKEIVEKFFSDQLEEVFLGFEDQDKGEKSAAAPSKSSISSKNTKPKLTKVTVNFLRKVIYTLPFDREDDDIVTYLPVTSVQNCYQSTVKLLEEYALEHLIRLVRVLNLPGDNSFSIGVSGSGRQSLTALAAIICKNKLIHPECSKDYGRSEWHKDLKNALMEGGARKRNVTLLISEKAWNKSSFLQDIDVLLNSGEVPNIFAVEEIQEILEIIRLGTERSKGVSDSDPVSMLTKFKINCKKNIHVVICISPFGSFRESIRLYPSFVNCCTIDWFDEWPPDALEKIATVFLHDMKMSEEMKENVLDVCQYIHVTGREMAEYFYKKTGRRTYITNFSYLNLLRQLKVLSNQRMSDLNEARMRYLNGLRSLLFAAEQISAMKETLLLLHPQATQAAEEAALLALDVKREATQVQLATEMVLEEQRLAEAKAEEARLMKLECELDLSQLIPIFTEALEALDTLKPKDMTILKSMKNPPGIVKLVMEAVCIMLDVKPDRAVDPVTARKILDFWGPSMKIVTDINFLKHLKEYDKDNIPARIIDIIRKHYIAHKEFDPALVRKASRAAEGLCKWVIAMEKYDRVIKIVTPKKLRIQEADEFVQMTLKAVEEKKRYVKSYEEALNELRKRFEALEARRHEMERSVAQCITKADRADKIIAGLSSERERWTKSAAMCKLKYHNVIGDTLLSCAFMTYLGPYNKSFRKAIIAHWKKRVNIKKIPCDKNYGLVKIIGDEVLIQKWFTGNLPQDDFSIENAVLGINSMRWPLFIDPESQANNWIRSYYSTKNLEIVKVSRTKPYMSKMRAALVSAIPDGSPVLLENVEEELDTALDPILMKQTFFRSGFTYITYEDSTFKYHPEFKFFMTTKLRNPHFLPDVVNKVTVINFLLTKEAMEDQLQTSAVFYTRPTLEDKRTTMVSDKAMNMEYIKKLENRILEAMHKAKSKILDDTRVLKILNETKTLAVQIKEKQVLCRQIEIELASLRRHFTQLAVFSRILYECMSTLQSVDYMYRYSLPIFQRIYSLVVRGVVRENPYISWRSLQKKCIEEFMVAIFNFVCRGIFQKHRLLYSFLICIKVMMNSQITDQSQLMFFMTGPREMEEVITKPKQQWITKKAWEEICYLKKFKAFKDLPNHLTKHTRQWKNFYLAENPFKEPLPPSFQKKCTLFEKLMLVRAVRPDKLVLAVKKMVSCCLSSEFVDAKPISLLNCFNEYSKKSSPFLFILSPGVDPMISVRSLVNKVNKLEKLKVVSLGQGQLSLVEKYLTEAREAGSWVCLQNLHLAASWMDKLEEWFETILWECDFRFRLVLTSYPCEIIPERILQRCVKVAEEVPTGIRFNMIRTFHSAPITNPQFYHSCPNKNVEFSRLLFGLSLFHAVVVERKKYGPLGWNIPYGFNESDFNISACQIQAYINQYHELPLNAISYMTGECNYGGRVTDEWDRRTLMSIIKQFINPYIVKGNHYHVFEDDLASFIELPTKKNSFEDYLEIISEIPDKYPTEILGFHKNADIMRDLTGTNEFLGNLLDIQTKGGKKKQDSELLTILEDILKKLMKPFSIEKVVKKYPHKYEESMNIVLVQEMQRFNHLTKTIKTSLKELKSAIFGFTILSPELEAVGHSLIINRIPVAWRSASYPTLKSLSSYISDLIERLTFFHGWFKIGHPVSYWMSGFFFQQGFITAAMQNYARKRSIPIDLLGFDFKILNNPKSLKYPERGVYVHGLFIQGARWNSEIHRLAEQLANAFSEPMPTIWLIPMEKKQIEVGDRYVCPLYKTSERKGVLSTTGHSTNFVIAMLLDCSKTPDHWIRRGCALLCQLD